MMPSPTPAGPEPPGRISQRLGKVFRCQLCFCVVPPRTPAHTVVVQTRTRKYPYRREAFHVVEIDARGKRKVKPRDDPGGIGREAVRELVVCPTCAAQRNGD